MSGYTLEQFAQKVPHAIPDSSSDVPPEGSSDRTLGSALGPDWSLNVPMRGTGLSQRSVHVEYKVEVQRILTPRQVLDSKLVVSEPEGATCQHVGELPVNDE